MGWILSERGKVHRFSFRLIWGWSCQERRGGCARGGGRLERVGGVWRVGAARGAGRRDSWSASYARPRGSQDLGSSQRPLSEIERRHPWRGGWLTGESADVRVCA